MSKPIPIGQAIARMYAKIALDNMQNKSIDKPRSLLSDLLNDSPIPVDRQCKSCLACDGAGGCGTCRTFHSVPHVPQ